MTNELTEAIIQTIHSESNNNPAPTLARVSKVYEDNNHINAELLTGETLKYIKTIGNPSINDDAIIIFLDGKYETPIAITK